MFRFDWLKDKRVLVFDDEKLTFSTFRCAPDIFCTYSLGYVYLSFYKDSYYENCFMFKATTTDDSSWVAIGEPKDPNEAYQEFKDYFSSSRKNFDPKDPELLDMLRRNNFWLNN